MKIWPKLQAGLIRLSTFRKWRTHTNFVTSTAYTSDPVYLQNLPSDQTVSNTGGGQAWKIRYFYDAQDTSTCTRGSATLTPAGTLFQHNASVGNERGNLRCMSQWRNLPTAAELMTGFGYDTAGNRRSITDPKGQTTGFTYSNPGSGLVTGMTNAAGQVFSTDYDYFLRKPISFTDPDANITQYFYSDDGQGNSNGDAFDRLSRVRQPAMETRFRYEDSLRRVNTDVRTNSLAGAPTWSARGQVEYDGYGREVFVRKFVPGSSGTDTIQTAKNYDGAGRVSKTSNPVIGTGVEWTTESYFDGLDRVVKLRQLGQDGNWAETKTDYLGQSVEVTEPGGRKRRTVMDALGRTASVVEAPGVSGYGFTTSYGYNALDKLTGVSQGAQTRTFTYDSLGRMLTATNPERSWTGSGMVAEEFGYDHNGNVETQKDARGVTMTMVYDALNRVTSRTYATAPADGSITTNTPESFVYDTCANGKGKLCSATNGVGGRGYTYDSMGRVKTAQQTMTGVLGSPWNFVYDYTVTGQLDKLTYPSSRQVQHGYDAADRLTSVSSGLVSVGIPKYHPQGTPEEVLYGNGVKEVWTLNKRLQVGSIAVTKGGASLLTLGYGYGTGGENNGNVRTQSIQAGGHTFAQSYNYDALNRLETASETTTVPSASNWSIGFQYDQYGNMAANGWTISVPAAMATSLAQYDPATNRRSRTAGGATISPNPYDKGGNLTSDPALGTMQYDQAGRLRQTQVLGKTITYDYDAEGRRVRRDYPGLGTTYYVYDGVGQLAAEYGASEPMSCTRCYLTADTLGSTRLMTDELGGVKHRTDYLPFGDLITASPTQGGGRQVITDGTAQTTFALAGGPTQKFTGKERDAETGLDYFGARYLSSGRGRFISPDPGSAGSSLANPQSWNGFNYALNNPLRIIDPDGYAPIPAKDWRIQLTLAADPTLRHVINRAPNYSPAQFEQNMKSGKFDQALTGAAGEAVMFDSWNSIDPNGSLAISQPNNSEMDLLVMNKTGGYTMSGVVASSNDSLGLSTYTSLDSKFQAEIKTLNPANALFVNEKSIRAGVEQIARRNVFDGHAFLVLDTKAWSGLPETVRKTIFESVARAGGSIVLRQGLYDEAQRRSGFLKKLGAWLTGTSSGENGAQ